MKSTEAFRFCQFICVKNVSEVVKTMVATKKYQIFEANKSDWA